MINETHNTGTNQQIATAPTVPITPLPRPLQMPVKRILSLILSATTLSTLPSQADVTTVPLGGIAPGSETVTLVENGDFEDHSSGNIHSPTAWSRNGDMFYDGQPAGVIAPNSGTGTARMHIDHPDGPMTGIYMQEITGLEENTEYVLSAYMWNLGDIDHAGIAFVDMNDVPGETELALSEQDADARDGYFSYGTFNTANTGTSFTLRLFMVGPGLNVSTPWPDQPTSALWDNVAITPAAQFVAPTPDPEPNEKPFAIVDITLDEATGDITLTWNSKTGTSYGIFYGTDLVAWGGELDDRYPADAGETTTYAFNRSDLFDAASADDVFFRVALAVGE